MIFDDDKFVKTTVKLHGKRMKAIVAIEELSELTKELTKDLKGEGNREKIVEEMADVTIVLDQLFYIYGVSENEFKEIIEYKVKRQIARDNAKRADIYEREAKELGKSYESVEELFEELEKE